MKYTTPPNYSDADSHSTNIITGTWCSGEIWWVICEGIFTLQVTDMADLHGINITDNLRNVYK